MSCKFSSFDILRSPIYRETNLKIFKIIASLKCTRSLRHSVLIVFTMGVSQRLFHSFCLIRLHPYEGKRSCRCRLAAHNKRRRKRQNPRLLVPGSRDNSLKCDLDIVNLLAVLTCAKGMHVSFGLR